MERLEDRMGMLEERISSASSPASTLLQDDEVAEDPVSVNRIAFVARDGNLYTVRPDGNDRVQLTGLSLLSPETRPLEQASFWPTWSPDGQTLVFSQLTREDASSSISVSLLAVDIATLVERELYVNPTTATPLIAPGTPHYMSWSPDSSRLTFLAMEPEGQVLRMSHPTTSDETRKLAQLAPLYHVWSPDGDALLFHTNRRLSLVQDTTIRDILPLEAETLTFRTPAWSPDGRRVAYVATDDIDQNNLMVASPIGSGTQVLAQVGAKSAFLWSPSAELIAIVDSPDPTLAYFTELRLVSPTGDQETILAKEPILAFFWSPDGQRIAYVALNEASLPQLTWKIIDIRGGESHELTQFLPSPLFQVLLIFFDQYAHSHSIWAPDSSQILFVGRLSGQEEITDNGAGADPDIVYTVNVVGDPVTTSLGSGHIATWSWR